MIPDNKQTCLFANILFYVRGSVWSAYNLMGNMLHLFTLGGTTVARILFPVFGGRSVWNYCAQWPTSIAIQFSARGTRRIRSDHRVVWIYYVQYSCVILREIYCFITQKHWWPRCRFLSMLNWIGVFTSFHVMPSLQTAQLLKRQYVSIVKIVKTSEEISHMQLFICK